MHEGFIDGEPGSHYRGSDHDPDVEAKEYLELLWTLLAKLIEQGGDLPAQTKKAMRMQIQGILAKLNIQSLEDYEGLSRLNERLDVKSRLPEPEGYPPKSDFEHYLREIYVKQGSERLPKLPKTIHATDVAQFGQSDWKELTGRGVPSGIDYLYDLGKVLASNLAYSAAFNETDIIQIGPRWTVENGRHRTLVLRALGPEYVSVMDMNRWVHVEKEK